jgi:hypothetical protein
VNCDDYLSMLATLPVEELAYGGARDHAARCRDCDRTTRAVAERERNMLMAFGDLQQSVPARHVAERALLLSRRRSVTLYYRIGLAAATVATILIMFLWRQASAPLPGTSVSETFRLRCLSPEQAAEVLRPHIKTTGHVSFRANSPVGIIRVEASPEEMESARSLLGRYDSPAESQCAVQVTVPQVP